MQQDKPIIKMVDEFIASLDQWDCYAVQNAEVTIVMKEFYDKGKKTRNHTITFSKSKSIDSEE